MIVGPSTSDKLQIVTTANAAIASNISWVAVNVAAPPVPQDTDNELAASITTATVTDILVGAASTKKRVLDWAIHNTHATAQCGVTIRAVDGTNTNDAIDFTLLAGESAWFDGSKWLHYDANGGIYGPTSKLDAKLVVTSDVINATTSFADITGLTVPLLSGKKYAFQAELMHINNATTTGSRFGVNIGAAPTVLAVSTIDTVTASVTASVHSAGTVAARDTAVTAQTTGSAAITLAHIMGYIQPSADGTFAMRFASEVAVAAGITVKAGSWLRIWEVDN